MKNSVDRGAWRATVHAVAESDMTEHPPNTHIALFNKLSQNIRHTGQINGRLNTESERRQVNRKQYK